MLASTSHPIRWRFALPLALLALAITTASCGEPDPGMPDTGMPDAGGSDGGELDAGPPTCEGPPGLYITGSCTDLADGVRPFNPMYWLWTDGADKERFVYLPPGTTIDTTDPNAWIFPVGTRLYKTFIRDGLRIETRVNEKVSDGMGTTAWTLRTFAWSMDQLSVTEVTAGVVNALGTEHDIPATTLCATCHRGAAVDVGLGFSAIQLNHDVGNPTSLAYLNDNGWLSSPIDVAAAVIPGDATTSAALGYMHANCGGCHGGPSALPAGNPMRLWIDIGITDVTTTGPYLTAIDTTSSWGGGAYFRITRGDPSSSSVMLRMMSRTVPDLMPPVGTEIVDDTGLASVSAWISSL